MTEKQTSPGRQTATESSNTPLRVERSWRWMRVVSPSTEGVFGFGVGLAVVVVALHWIARTGLSLIPVAVGLAAGLIGAAACLDEGRSLRGWKRTAVLVALPAWVACTWGVGTVGDRLLAVVPLAQLDQPLFQIGALLPIGLLSLGVTAALAVIGANALQVTESSTARFVCGIGCGLLAGVWFVGPLIGAAWTVLVIAVCVLISIGETYRTTERKTPFGPTALETAAASPLVLRFSIALLCGAAFALLMRMLGQLQPVTAPLIVGTAATFVFGIALGCHPVCRTRMRIETACWLALGSVSAAVLAFPLLIDFVLALTASDRAGVVMTLGAWLPSLIVLPLGVCCGLITSSHARRVIELRMSLTLWLCGWSVVRLSFLTGVSTTPLVLGVATALLTCGVFATWRSVPQPKLRVRLAEHAAACLLLLSTGLFRSNYSPQTAARLLFSTPTRIAYHAGIPKSQLLVIDEAECVATAEGESQTLTVWQAAGERLEFRRGGVPVGSASLDVEICPQTPEQLLPTVLSMSLHAQPSRVLLLGIESGVALDALLRYPVQAVHVVESDPALRNRVLNDVVESTAPGSSADPRIVPHAVSAECAIRSAGTYDVVLALQGHAALASDSGRFTREFYRAACERLDDRGVFCQRVVFADLGREPLRAILETARREFLEVIAVEVGAGEVVLLGSRSEGVLVPADFAQRLQEPQTIGLLAGIGWDWAEMLNLLAISPEKLSTTLGTDRPTPNTTFSNRFALRFPTQLQSWEPKQAAARAELDKVGGRYLEWILTAENEAELVRRVGEVNTQRRLRTETPDRPWSYRTAVREQILESPRTLLTQKSGRLARHEMHPEDRRRLDYFQALADAAKQESLSETDLDAIWACASPYDPLLTEFAHHEIARLHAKLAPQNPAAELRHRLHLVHYSKVGDRSVRDIIAAVHLLTDHESTVPDDLTCRRHLDALLEQLRLRWAARGVTRPKGDVGVLLNDVTKSIAACEAAFGWLEEWASTSAEQTQWWHARERQVRNQLVSTLKEYESVLHRHYQRRQRNLQILEEDPESFGKVPEPLAN